jgi:hypothetical protein
MERFTLIIKTENDAFAGEGFSREIARILRAVADRVECGETAGAALDANGNRVCEFGED